MIHKKVPMRTCIGCRESKPKKELIRIVRVSQKLLDEGKASDKVCIDPVGKISGRGAYICPDPECLKSARKNRRLEKEFEMAVEDEVYDLLEEELKKLSG